jgi:hypothetical protein
MSSSSVRLLGVLLLAGSCGLVSPARAQAVARGREGLRARMAEFLDTLSEDGPTDPMRRFFPTTGDWSYTHTVHLASGRARIQRWTFPAAQTSLLFGFGKGVEVNPVWDSFLADQHGQIEGLLISVVGVTPWRLVGRNRFVPPEAPASSPVFVDWRREHGRWVIAAFGDERHCRRALLGYVTGSIVRERPLPERTPPVYAANERWYVDGDFLFFDAQRYWKYGQPRELQPDDLEPFGWKGEVRVYVEKGYAHVPIVLYVPTAPDIYQPYQAIGRGRDPFCRATPTEEKDSEPRAERRSTRTSDRREPHPTLVIHRIYPEVL